MHGLIFETSVCYWQNQPGFYFIQMKTRYVFSIHMVERKKELLVSSSEKNY